MRGSILQPVLSLTDYFFSEMLLTDEFLEISNLLFLHRPVTPASLQITFGRRPPALAAFIVGEHPRARQNQNAAD